MKHRHDYTVKCPCSEHSNTSQTRVEHTWDTSHDVSLTRLVIKGFEHGRDMNGYFYRFSLQEKSKLETDTYPSLNGDGLETDYIQIN